MESKKINQLATEMAPVASDLTIIGDPITGVSKKITLEQLAVLFGGAISFYSNYASFPATGDVDIIYCAKDTNKLYLWNGAYVEIFPSQAVLDTYQLRSEKGNANGYASLDSLGKVPVSQLPSSLMEYKGTWNASTNTPTLANGTGDTGDVYICSVAGTVNFGAGAITFAVGDYVIYSGSIWQRSSGATGTVTSVAVTESGDALTITGSPITTSGTINIGFAGTSAQYVAGDGSLITFPTIVPEAQKLVTEVYNSTGATLTKGTVVYINGGQGNLPTVTKAIATGDSTSAQTYGVVKADITNMNNGYVVVMGALGDLDTQAYSVGTQLYLSSTTAGAWTSTKQYAPAHLVYVGIVVRSHPTQGVVEIRIQNGFELDELHNVSAQTPSNNDGIFYNSSTTLWENKSIATALGYTPANDSLVVKLAGAQTITGVKTFSGQPKFDTAIAIKEGTSGTLTGYTCIGANVNQLLVGIVGATHTFTFPTSSSYTYTLPSGTGTLALTSDIPSLTGYVTLATSQTITGDKTFTGVALFNDYQARFGGGVALSNTTSGGAVSGHTVLGANADGLQVNLAGGAYNNLKFANTATGRNYTFPDASGTLALTSDLSSYVPTSRTLTINGTTYDLSANRSWTIAEGLGGSGTTNYVAKFTGSTSVGNSLIFDNGTNVGIGTASPSLKLHVVGDIYSTTGMFIGNAGGYFATLNTLNGLYLDSTNFLTLNTNGNERLRITSAGNVGIGTSTPSAISNYVALTINGTSGSFTEYQQGGSYAFRVGSDSSIGGFISQTDANPIRIFTNAAERMRITSTGNVGIGVTSPVSISGYKTLQVGGETTGALLELWANSERQLQINGSTSAIDIYAARNVPMIFYTNSAERMRITGGGNVGIGTASPTNKLTLYNTVAYNTVNDQLRLIGNMSGGGSSSTPAYNGGIAFTQDATDFAYIRSIQTSPANAWTSRLSFWTLNGNGGTPIERMAIDNSGNVGIGTTTPTSGYKLDVKGLVRIGNDSAANVLQMGDLDANSTYIQSVSTGGVARNLVFYNTGETMRISSAGNVGIGTTSPSFKLDVQGGSIVNGNGTIQTALTYATMGIVGTLSNHDLAVYANNAERMRITSGGAVLIGKTTKNSFTSTTPIEVNGELAAYGSYAGVFFENRATAGTMYGWYGNGSGIYLYNQSYGDIGVFGLSTGNYTALSDKNKKKDFEQSEIGLNEILGLKPTLYRMKSDSNEAPKQLGFIAQEVKDFIPQAYVEQDNFIGLNEMPIIAALVKAIQELKKEIDELKNK